MLVFISDLHLTDGSTCTTIGRQAFTHFAEDLTWMVRQAYHRADEQLAQRGRVDLILLGDIFDVLRTRAWQDASFVHGARLRPWTPEMCPPETRDDAHRALAQFVEERTRAIIGHNNGHIKDAPAPDLKQGGLAALRRLAESGVWVRREEGDARDLESIPVKIWYMVGNHDWFYNVDRPEYQGARDLLIHALGLSNEPGRPFPHTMRELDLDLRIQLERHRVFAQHGDIDDVDNFRAEDPAPGGRRARASLGDAIVIELIDGLEEDLLRGLADDEISSDPLFRQALKEIDNVRPLLAIPEWLSGVIQRFAAKYPGGHKDRDVIVLKVLRARLERILAEPFVKMVDRPLEFDTVDTLTVGKLVAWLASLDRLAWVTEKLEGSRMEERGLRAYRQHAQGHLSAASGDIDYVVMGHTHAPDLYPLDLQDDHGRIYINTGTWRPVHLRCASHEREFLSGHVMSYAAIYADGERGGRRYETWTGTLGLGPNDLTQG